MEKEDETDDLVGHIQRISLRSRIVKVEAEHGRSAADSLRDVVETITIPTRVLNDFISAQSSLNIILVDAILSMRAGQKIPDDLLPMLKIVMGAATEAVEGVANALTAAASAGQ